MRTDETENDLPWAPRKGCSWRMNLEKWKGGPVKEKKGMEAFNAASSKLIVFLSQMRDFPGGSHLYTKLSEDYVLGRKVG